MSLLRYCTCTCNVLISERSVHQVTVATFARGLTCILEPVGRFAVRDTSRLLAGRELALLVKAAGWLLAWPWAGPWPCPKAALPPSLLLSVNAGRLPRALTGGTATALVQDLGGAEGGKKATHTYIQSEVWAAVR